MGAGVLLLSNILYIIINQLNMNNFTDTLQLKVTKDQKIKIQFKDTINFQLKYNKYAFS